MKTSKTILKSGLLTLAVGASFGGAAQAQNQPSSQVYLNGSPLRLAVAPMQQNGRTLVPMRDIFEALGATVNYNSLNQSIAAQKGSTIVRLAIGSRNADVNNVRVMLDAPARTYYGSTFVPLRFVSEALGAQVSFNASNRIVSISDSSVQAGSGTQVAGIRQISIPAQSVIPVTLDSDISSATATAGQTISATVVSERLGDSEFPAGTKLEGVITESTPTSGETPGVLDLRFRSAVLPDGTRVALQGNPIGLDNDSVSTEGGRFIAKPGARKNNTAKVIGVGAGAGFLIGKLLKKDGLLPSIIGAAGGFLYDRNKKKDQAVDARLAAGTKIGVRLNQGVAYRDTTGYANDRGNFVKL